MKERLIKAAYEIMAGNAADSQHAKQFDLQKRAGEVCWNYDRVLKITVEPPQNIELSGVKMPL